MMKKTFAIVAALLLALSVMTGCGGGGSASGGNKETEEPVSQNETGTGTAELNQVIYDANGIKITAVSAEDHMEDLADLNDESSVLELNLHIERTGTEKNMLKLFRANTNGFETTGRWAFTIGSDVSNLIPLSTPELPPFLMDADEEDVMFSVGKSHVDALGLKSIGEIGFILDIIRENGDHSYESVKVGLGKPAEPACGVNFEEGSSFQDFGCGKITNRSDSVMNVELILKAFDTEGKPLYMEGYDYETGETYRLDSYHTVFRVRNGAEALPFGSQMVTLYSEDGEHVSGKEVGSVKVEYVAAYQTKDKDLTDAVSYEMEGRWEESSNFMLFRCTWPEEYPRLNVYGTCFIYNEDGTLYDIEKINTTLCCDDDYRDWSSAANQETGALDIIAIDCKKEGSGGEFTFDIQLTCVLPDEH